MPFKVIIAGGRDFNDMELLTAYCDNVLSRKKNVEIVSGGCKGADRLGEIYSVCRGHTIIPFPADWEKHGKAAGPIRNKQMADYADALIAFWDGKSRGTKNMIDTATEKRLLIRVCEY